MATIIRCGREKRRITVVYGNTFTMYRLHEYDRVYLPPREVVDKPFTSKGTI